MTSERTHPPDVQLQLTVRDGVGGNLVVEVYLRKGMTGSDLAAQLHKIADGFAHGGALRIR